MDLNSMISGQSCLGEIARNKERAKAENRCEHCGQVKTPLHHTIWHKPQPSEVFTKRVCYDVTPDGETRVIYEKELAPNADR